MNKDFRFDFDLKFGEGVENSLLKALEGKIEVKAERDHWARTGNIAIEFSSRGKLSGISTTEAAHWTQVLMVDNTPFCYLIFPTPVVKGMVKYYVNNRPETVIRGGDNNTSKMVLLPLKEIIIPKLVGVKDADQ
jgi:hypothetical protein